MYKACSRCGKIHDTKHRCNVNRVYQGGKERELRNTYAWEKKSIEVRDKANYLCEVCKDQGIYNYNGLEVHHITKVKDDAEGLLDNKNLVCLCVAHHKLADKGQIDNVYLRELARIREDK